MLVRVDGWYWIEDDAGARYCWKRTMLKWGASALLLKEKDKGSSSYKYWPGRLSLNLPDRFESILLNKQHSHQVWRFVCYSRIVTIV